MAEETRVKYQGRDFDTLFDDLTFRLKDNYADDYNDFATSSLGIVLLDIISYGLDQLSWYQDRRATEAFLETALNRASVSRLTRPLGYQMRPATSATVYVSLTPAAAQLFGWSVSTGYAFSGPNGLVFEALESVAWAVGDASTKTILLREGQTKKVTATSNGTENQEIRLSAADSDGKYLVNGSVRVVVDGSQWNEVDFLEFETTDQFEVHYHEEPPVIRFGNGIAGNVPADTAEIRITYVVNSGKAGNVASNTIISGASPLVQSFTTIPFTVTNLVAASGGADAESLNEAKAKAPKYFATRAVAVVRQDYESLALSFNDPQYGTVAAASAYVAREFRSDLIGASFVGTVQQAIYGYQSVIDGRSGVISTELDIVQVQGQAIAIEQGEAVAQVAQVTADASAALDNVIFIEKTAPLSRTLEVLQNQTGVLSDYAVDLDTLEDYLRNTIATATSIAYANSLRDQWKPDIELSRDTYVANYKATAEAAAAGIRSAAEDIQAQNALTSVNLSNIGASNTLVLNSRTAAQVEATALLSDTLAHQVEANEALTALQAHYTTILSADCKANLITVPILTFDIDGFYTAPTNGLLRRLETSLEAVADVAHSVRVVDGSPALVPADVTVQVKILESAVFSEVNSDIDAEIRQLLKARRFSISLFLSTLYELIEVLDGIDIFDVEITTTYTPILDGSTVIVGVDTRGNLLVDEEHVITLGVISITEKAE